VSAPLLQAALRAGADGICTLDAATGLLIAHGTWLARDDFTSRFICHGPEAAAIDWEAAIGALNADGLPSSSGERRMLVLAASIAGGIPVSLSDTLPGIDHRNARLVIKAIAHAMGGLGQ
jgi:hypothetical protein